MNNKILLGITLLVAHPTIQGNEQSNTTAAIDSYQYDEAYKNVADANNQTTAVLVVAFNRPDYFKLCLQAIEKNPEAQTIPFIFALDGGTNATQEENTKLINKANIKTKIILARNRNYGCPKNHIDSKRFAFDWCNFKKVIVLEEDIVITPNYFTFLLNLHQWATKNYDNIGMVQAWSYCVLSQEEKQKRLNLVQENPLYWNYVTYCMDSACWQKVRTILYTFEDFVDQIPHDNKHAFERSKPSNWHGAPQVRQWVKAMATEKMAQPKKTSPRIFPSRLRLNNEFNSPRLTISQDNMMGMAFYMHDLVKIESVVNRAMHIGVEGITTDKKRYDTMYGRITLTPFAQDKNIKEFTLVTKK